MSSLSCSPMYMLHVANAANEAKNIMVDRAECSNPSALPMMSIRLRNCIVISVVVFIILFFKL